MARKLYYKVIDDGQNRIADDEWEAILRLQHWYNSEFVWTAGRLAFKMYAVFPNLGQSLSHPADFIQLINRRRVQLENQGLSENRAIQQLEEEGLIIAQKGGYFDKCLASGFTRVASNEFNAYLVCEFLLKASLLAPNVTISTYDEGEFVKPKYVMFSQGGVILSARDKSKEQVLRSMISNHHVFAIVDSAKYDHLPRFQNIISGFNDMTIDEKLSVLKDWNWLGFESNFDINGDDIQGYDLNKKIASFRLEDSPDDV